MSSLTVRQLTCARIPTVVGEFRLCLYGSSLPPGSTLPPAADDKEHLALVMGDVAGKSDVLVRVHSECFTGDVLGSERCDCGPQLQHAIRAIAAEGMGVVVYLRQEGRGIGLLNKLRAYNLQDEGYDTVDANLILGHQADERDYGAAAQILEDLGVRSINLLTNNPTKIERLRELGVEVGKRVALPVTVTPHNFRYLQAKAARMNHQIDIGDAGYSMTMLGTA